MSEASFQRKNTYEEILRDDHFCDLAYEALGVNGDLSLADIRQEMPEPTVFHIGARAVKAVILEPPTKDYDDTRWIVRMAEAQQPYNEMQYIGAEITRQIVAPDSPMIMFQNNSFRTNTHRPGFYHKEQAANGSFQSMAEDKVRVLEQLSVSKAVYTGYSQGARMAIGMANVGSDRFELTHVNADEAPSATVRGTRQLQKDFMNSGSFGAQREAMTESDMSAVQELSRADRLGLDYVKFGLASLLPHNRLMQRGMTNSINDVLSDAITKNPDVTYKVGYIENSLLFDPASLSVGVQKAVDLVRYEGEGFHGHASVNNPFIQAAMLYDGLRPTAELYDFNSLKKIS